MIINNNDNNNNNNNNNDDDDFIDDLYELLVARDNSLQQTSTNDKPLSETKKSIKVVNLRHYNYRISLNNT